MSQASMNFGVQSYCFRHFTDNHEVAAKVKEIGVSSIEICGIHADFNDVEAWKDVVKIYEDAGVNIVSIGVQTFTGDAEVERKWFECAQIAGAKHISAHFTVGTFREAVPATAALCKEFGIKVGIHTHGGYMFGGSPDVMTELISLGDGEIGICLDTAWCMQIGPARGNPVQWLEEFKDSIFGVHYKDFIFESNAQWQDVVVGTGTLDLPAFVDKLNEIGFDGMAVIEYEADVEAPVPALTECVNKMRELAQ
ncbi:MAG: sugar phosphate isomerase/epimerase [Lentisphaeria bacterium]|nr:sugar phosphate isomerase/epimerase [Lentisphaeria bacterium]NQZ67141.1 sugar phosphate isomerase/epimerase [Lentisphaeria bacterium]